VKRIARATGRSIGDVVSELVAVALGRTDRSEHRLSWTTKAMDARIDLEDKDALHRALDGR
jgi:hypothetical protein